MHVDFPKAYTRDRKLGGAGLTSERHAQMYSGRTRRVLGHLEQRAQPMHHVSQRAFFSARANLSATANFPSCQCAASIEAMPTPSSSR